MINKYSTYALQLIPEIERMFLHRRDFTITYSSKKNRFDSNIIIFNDWIYK